MLGKICIIGDGITALMLTKVLLDLNIESDLINKNIFNKTPPVARTLAISNNNFLFLKKESILSEKMDSLWKINKINIFNLKLKSSPDLLINFKNKENNPLFYMIKYNNFFLNVKSKIKKNPLLRIFNNKNIKNLLGKQIRKNNYNLVINCSSSNFITKKLFYKKINKDYNAVAFTTIIKHNKFSNNIASQYFTELGPLAFLPISKNHTSVVWSVKLYNKKNENFISNKIIKKKIRKLFPLKSNNISFSSINKFNLNFSIPKEYYKKNILAFGDGLHKIHPLAGQGLNMGIRDIKILKSIIEKRINLGLEINETILVDFTDRIKSYNFFFAEGIDFMEKYFSINNSNFNKYSKKIFNYINKNLFMKQIFVDFADKGIEHFIKAK